MLTEDEVVERMTSGLWLQQLLLFRKVENVEETDWARMLFDLDLLCSITWFVTQRDRVGRFCVSRPGRHKAKCHLCERLEWTDPCKNPSSYSRQIVS